MKKSTKILSKSHDLWFFGAIFEIPRNKWLEYHDLGAFFKSAQKLLPRWQFLGLKINNKKTGDSHDIYGKLLKFLISKIMRQVWLEPLVFGNNPCTYYFTLMERNLCVGKAETIFFWHKLINYKKFLGSPVFNKYFER